MRRKTIRRTKRQAETLAQSLKDFGHTDVVITRITETDWAIVYTERQGGEKWKVK